MKIILILVLFTNYFFHRAGIRAYFSLVSKERTVNRIRNDSTFFLRVTGLYLLKCRKGMNIISFSLIISIVIELFFIPVAVIMFLLTTLGIFDFDRASYIIDIMYRYVMVVWYIMTSFLIYCKITKKIKL